MNRHHEVRDTLAFKPHASRRTLRTSSLRLGPAAFHWCNSENTPGLWDQAITIMVPGSEWSPDKKETILVKASEFQQLSLCISLGLPCVEKDATIQQRAWWYRRVYLTSGYKWAIHPSPGHRTSWANNSNPKGTQRFLDSLVHYTPLGDHHPCLGEQDRINTWKVTATARDVQTTELTYEIWKDIGKLSLKKRTTLHNILGSLTVNSS